MNENLKHSIVILNDRSLNFICQFRRVMNKEGRKPISKLS